MKLLEVQKVYHSAIPETMPREFELLPTENGFLYLHLDHVKVIQPYGDKKVNGRQVYYIYDSIESSKGPEWTMGIILGVTDLDKLIEQ